MVPQAVIAGVSFELVCAVAYLGYTTIPTWEKSSLPVWFRIASTIFFAALEAFVAYLVSGKGSAVMGTVVPFAMLAAMLVYHVLASLTAAPSHWIPVKEGVTREQSGN
jgi:hypothetical protein